MSSVPNATRSALVALPLAVVCAVALSLASACSSRGSQASSVPDQLAEAPPQKPAEGGNTNPAAPLPAGERSTLYAGLLLGAAAAGHVERVKHLLADNPDSIYIENSRGFTPLHGAAGAGHADVVRVLLDAGADPNGRAAPGNQTPLHLAAKIGSQEICEALLAAAPELWYENKDGATALGVAVQEGHVDLVRLLADANVKRLSRPVFNLQELPLPVSNGLHLAAASNNTEIMNILLKNRKDWMKEEDNIFGFSLDEKDILDVEDHANNSNAALHVAAENGYTELARLLVQAGADSMAQNSDGKTPVDLANEQGHTNLAHMLQQVPKLHAAAAAGNVEVVKKLLNEEQSINVKHPRDGYTPLHEAVRKGHVDVVQVLLDAGADLFLQDNNQATALDVAFEKSRVEIAKMIRRAGGITNLDTKPFLKSAVSSGNTEMVGIITEHLITNGRKRNRSIYSSINYNINDFSYYATVDDEIFGTSLLHVAAANGYTDVARHLVQAGAYVMAHNDDRKTPIDLAREQGHDNLAQMLASAVALREAALAGHGEKVEQLLAAGAPTDAQDPDGATVLYRVVQAYLEPSDSVEGHMEVLKSLIKAGAKVDSITRWARGRGEGDLTFSNSSPLHVAALAGRADVVALLVEAGKGVNGYLDFRNHRNTHTALSLALIENPNEAVAMLLIQAGANVNAADHGGTTPLHTVAAMHENPAMSVNIAAALINAGANINPQTVRTNTLSLGSGRTPLHTAASANHMEMARLLIQHGARVNVKDDSDNAPLHLAIHGGHGKLAELLMESGAYIHSRNYNGNLPIQVAAFAGLPDVITQLIAAGSPVNAQDQVGDTPLHDAALQGQVEAAQVLIGAGADVNATNKEGKTPLDLAVQHEHGRVAAVLKAAAGQ